VTVVDTITKDLTVANDRGEFPISAEDQTEIRKLVDKSLKILCAGPITSIYPYQLVRDVVTMDHIRGRFYAGQAF
jgi:hypothetical protein